MYWYLLHSKPPRVTYIRARHTVLIACKAYDHVQQGNECGDSFNLGGGRGGGGGDLSSDDSFSSMLSISLRTVDKKSQFTFILKIPRQQAAEQLNQ